MDKETPEQWAQRVKEMYRSLFDRGSADPSTELARVKRERDARLWLRPRADHPPEFQDGDTYLVGLRVSDSRHIDKRSSTTSGVFWEWSVVEIRCDEDYFSVYEVETMEPWGWQWDDVEVWAKLTPAAALSQLAEKVGKNP